MMRHFVLSTLVLSLTLVTACGGDKSAAKSKNAASGGGDQAQTQTPVKAASGETPTADLTPTAYSTGTPTSRPADAPGDQETPTSTPTPPTPPEPLPPLKFVGELPEGRVASVDGQNIDLKNYLTLLLEQNLSTVATTLIAGRVLELELVKEKIDLTEEDVTEELQEMVERIAPGKSIDEIAESGGASVKHLRAQARTQRGWKKVFWKVQKIPVDQRHEVNQLLLTFIVRQRMDAYEVRIRGGNGVAPHPGLVATLKDKNTDIESHITADEALDFLVGLVRQDAMIQARTDLVDAIILDREIKRLEVAVAEQDVLQWVNEQYAKHPPPFTWEQICRIKGTTPDREKERYRKILAWRKATGTEATPEQLTEFRKEHSDFFKGANRKVSHILVRTTNDVTNMPLEADAKTAARKKIEALWQKAKEGVDFGYLAENYSDDVVTARGKGKMAQPIKKWGGNLDAAFQDAVWTLDGVGDMTKPIESRYGWHIIKLDEHAEGREPPSWDNPRYIEWVLDEYETKMMEEWLGTLRTKAKIDLCPDADLFKIKDHAFWTPEK